MIADLAARRLDQSAGDAGQEVLSDAAMVWAVINLMEDVYTDARDVQVVATARIAFNDRLTECDLSVSELFEHIVGAVEADDLDRFGLSPSD